jgi:hypothetical protein
MRMSQMLAMVAMAMARGDATAEKWPPGPIPTFLVQPTTRARTAQYSAATQPKKRSGAVAVRSRAASDDATTTAELAVLRVR